jgi:tetraacyldisaccharide 4'-kinase
MNWWQILLFPFAIIYDLITTFRNWAYDLGVFKVHRFEQIQIISVGNLSVGGTGKTPMVEYLISKGILNGKKMAVLSRGYGRKTKGLRVVNESDSATEVGDESYGYFLKFGNKVKVVVAESRVVGINHIINEYPDIQLVILDDAFQHRSVKPNTSILLTTYQRPFWKDFVIPAGRLREKRSGAKRADAVIVTKCPETYTHLRAATGVVAFTSVGYGDAVMQRHVLASRRIVALAGLANNEPFFKFLKTQFELVKTYSFRDHMVYDEQNLKAVIGSAVENNAAIITTFKDAVKLMKIQSMDDVAWGYIPIEVNFHEGEAELDKLLAPYYHTSFQTK